VQEFYVETAADLGAARHEVPSVQHYGIDLLLHRKVFRTSIWAASLSVALRFGDIDYVVETEKIDRRKRGTGKNPVQPLLRA
jgi:hypothetical protein